MQQPDDFWKSTFRKNSCEAPDWGELLKGLIYILLALLFIPAMNLSGMISSRMDPPIKYCWDRCYGKICY